MKTTYNKEESYLNVFFNQTAIGVAFLAPDGRFLKASLKLCDIFAKTENELCELSLLDFLNPKESPEPIKKIEQMFSGKSDRIWTDVSFLNRYGIPGWININATLFYGEKKEPLYFICIIEDVTDRHTSALELKKRTDDLERTIRYKSEFLANMSHELRSPLNSLLILAQDLAGNNEGNLNLDQVKSAEIIFNSGHELLSLINEILDLSKVEAGKMTAYVRGVELSEIKNDTELSFEHMASNKEIQFSVHISNDSPDSIITDQQKLYQVIKNLVSNAIKFTEQGEIIINMFRPSPEVDLSNSGLEYQNSIAISVSDTGIGIPKKKQDFIFEAFSQADESTAQNYGGTGLGLSISGAFAELLGGEIMLKSKVGKGSVFTLYLPEKLEKSDNVEKDRRVQYRGTKSELKVSAMKDKVFEGVKVLVVDDDVRNLFALSKVLEEYSIDVHLAPDGKRAVEIVDEEDGLDIVLMDITMPEMDGYEVIRLIRAMEKGKDLPIIVQTARAMPGEFEKCVSAGANDFLPKPINIDNLLHKTKKILKK